MSQALIEQFKDSYRDMAAMELDALGDLYDEQILFKDPVHEVKGLPALRDYFSNIMGDVRECRFEFLDQLVTDRVAYIKWNMHFCHPKLSAGRLLTVRGVSQLQFDERIYYHEDIYDMGAMVYEHIPVFGGVTRWLKRRLAD